MARRFKLQNSKCTTCRTIHTPCMNSMLAAGLQGSVRRYAPLSTPITYFKLQEPPPPPSHTHKPLRPSHSFSRHAGVGHPITHPCTPITYITLWTPLFKARWAHSPIGVERSGGEGREVGREGWGGVVLVRTHHTGPVSLLPKWAGAQPLNGTQTEPIGPLPCEPSSNPHPQ